MALIKCPECGKEVSSSAKTCPYCGRSLISTWKRCAKFLLCIVILLILSFVIYIGYNVHTIWQRLNAERKMDTDIFSDDSVSGDEKQFINILKKYRDNASNLTSNVQIIASLRERTREIIFLPFNQHARNWVAYINKITTLDDNNVALLIEIYPNFILGTVIPNNDSLVESIKNLKAGDIITFSGRFIDNYAEIQTQINRERFTKPIFKFAIYDIQPGKYNPLLNREWWEHATLNDLERELNKDIDVNAIDNSKYGSNYTALHYAVTTNNEQTNGMVKKLIERGADVNAIDKWGNTVLLNAIGNSTRSLMTNFTDIKDLIENGADINAHPISKGCARIGDCESPLELALNVEYNLEVIDYLIKNGADVNDGNHPKERTPLMFAVSSYEPSFVIVNRLINEGADVNAKDSKGKTVLMWALYSGGTPKIVEKLLQSGADVNAKNVYGENALMIAKEAYDSPYSDKNNTTQIINILKKYGAKENLNDKLYNEASFKNVDSREFQALLRNGIEEYLKRDIEESNKYLLLEFGEEGAQKYSGDLSDYLQISTPYIPLPRLPVVFNNDNAEFTYEKYEITAGCYGEIRFTIPISWLKPFLVTY